jgi:hypothetical protein
MLGEDRSSFGKTLIAMLQSREAGLQTAALIAQAIASDALFNLRMTEWKDSEKAFDEDRFLELLDAYDDLRERCQHAWREFLIEKRADEPHRVLAFVRKRLDVEPMSTLKLED